MKRMRNRNHPERFDPTDLPAKQKSGGKYPSGEDGLNDGSGSEREMQDGKDRCGKQNLNDRSPF